MRKKCNWTVLQSRMKKTLFLYLSKQIFLATLIISVVLASALWLAQSVKLVQFVINGGAPLGMFFALMALTFPQLLTPILPLCFCFAVIFVYLRLYTDSELIILRGIGLSPYQLLKPMLAMAAAFMVAHWMLTMVLAPSSKRELRRQRSIIVSEYSAAALREGAFNSANADLTIYVNQRQGGDHYNGILIHDTRDRFLAVTITATEGRLIRRGDQSLLVIQQGTRQEKNKATGQINWLEFEEYVVNLNAMQPDKDEGFVKASERPLFELFTPPADIKPQDRMDFFSEAHQRLASPLWNPAYGLLALTVLLCGSYRRRGITRRVVLVGMGAIVMQGVLFGMNSIVSQHPSLIVLLYLVPVSVGLTALLLISASARGKL